MYECEEAIYQDALWKASSLKDRNGNYIQELRLKMRTESQNRKFICPECGEPLILNAGNIRQPYFSHYTGSECVLTNKEQGERNRRMRDAMLYFASLSFPDATILLSVEACAARSWCIRRIRNKKLSRKLKLP